MKQENVFKKWFMKSDLPKGWVHEFIEPNFGVHEGIPDAIIGFKQKGSKHLRYVWAEFKWATQDTDAVSTVILAGDGLRPAQIGWHNKWRALGADTIIIAGVKRRSGMWSSYVLPDNATAVPNPIASWGAFELTDWHDYIRMKGWLK